MKQVVLLTVLVQLMVAYEVSGNRDLMIHCAKMTVAIDGPLSMSSVEDGRLLMQFHELLSSHYPQTNQESVCLREAREKSYKGCTDGTRCPTLPVVNEIDCVYGIMMHLQCRVEADRSCEKSREILLDELSTCSISVGDSKLAKIIQAQRSDLAFNKTIIYQMEEIYRKLKEENNYW